MSLHLDFEVFSEALIGEAGTDNYFRHPSTEPMCLAWSVDGAPVRVWVPGMPVPDRLKTGLGEGLVHAHNAAFEWYCVNHLCQRYGFPTVPASRFRCSAARGRHANLPGKLEKLAAVLGSDPKDKEGHQVMLKLCKPNKNGERSWDLDKHIRMWGYCQQDVVTEQAAEAKLPPFPASEQKVWEFDRVVNQRGLPIDVDFCRGAMKILAEGAGDVESKLHDLTGGEIQTGGQIAKILEFVNKRGVNIGNLQADMVTAALEGDLPDDCRTLLELRQYASSAAVTKYKAARNTTSPDGRLRENSIYYGAAQTGRWSGIKFNHFNLKKGVKLDEELIEAITLGDYGLLCAGWKGSPIELLGKSVRGLICAPPGKRLVDADSGQIELRLAHWLAGDKKTLDMCAAGFDPYQALAAKNLGKRIEQIVKAERDEAKPLALGAQYGLGAARFADLTGYSMSKSKATIDKYRADNPEVVQMWRDLDSAAFMALRRGRPVRCGKVVFDVEGDWLTLRIPSGRKLYYYKPKVEVNAKGFPSLTFIGNKGYRKKIWGGHFTENLCQAICRDLLVFWMLALEDRGLPVILNVYDQIVSEVHESEAPEAAEEFQRVMTTAPKWAADVPLATDVKILKRWEK